MSEVDIDCFKKVEVAVRSQILRPYKHHKLFLYLLNLLLGVTLMLQGGKELENLLWSYIRFSIITSGKFN